MNTRIRLERDEHVAVITLDRAAKRNAFDLQMLRELVEAYTAFEDDPALRCAVVRANGEHFTAGLDLAEVGPAVASGAALFPDGVDPLSLRPRLRTKPVVMAVRGYCLTIGIELALASDIRIAADDTRFGQIEVNRGIFPFGGATIRMPLQCGWGNAMRWLLTGDLFDAAEAHRIGLVQEVVPPAVLDERALTLARTIARRAPLGIAATIASSRTAVLEGEQEAERQLLPHARTLMASEDAAEGLRSFVERREATFRGK